MQESDEELDDISSEIEEESGVGALNDVDNEESHASDVKNVQSHVKQKHVCRFRSNHSRTTNSSLLAFNNFFRTFLHFFFKNYILDAKFAITFKSNFQSNFPPV